MDKLGTTTNRVAVFWNADAPTTIQDQAFLDRMIPVAQKHNIQVVFADVPAEGDDGADDARAQSIRSAATPSR